ncbi:hypothetical protein BDN72DRAFT_828884 [Pluteus cervinus]|uniref:Uncharacterized protein n=1 Tax=Pluteus cervinus TaxID=181527 RepID=A0ACD3A415_9AGAR|nr:hypothetical protein BDN72DRAFT_828884 [Pluteus cervinus]
MALDSPLHPPVPNLLVSSDSALSGAMNSPTRGWLPQVVYVPRSKWKSATGRSLPPNPAIMFDYAGHSQQGVSMRAIHHGSAPQLEGSDDPVLQHTGLQTITLRIIWPGYEYIDFSRAIEIALPSGPITRSELAAAVSANFCRFLEKVKCSPSTGTSWTVGVGGIRFEHLVLVSLINTWENVWQAAVAIDVKPT